MPKRLPGSGGGGGGSGGGRGASSSGRTSGRKTQQLGSDDESDGDGGQSVGSHTSITSAIAEQFISARIQATPGQKKRKGQTRVQRSRKLVRSLLDDYPHAGDQRGRPAAAAAAAAEDGKKSKKKKKAKKEKKAKKRPRSPSRPGEGEAWLP
eukprot:TRINITY_DN11323_c0_g2_i1.p3 TRINITY_DN11323_c0_g2~~TRINITY_DN11323_c0_g2_i1.p3  ORF type:complete len:176 (+),score=43.66 TRINITY_DN11323_c0_g2_i1:73-528(+)